MSSSDTTSAALESQLTATRRLGLEGRVRMAADMSEAARQLAIEGVMRRHREYTPADARRAVLRGILGPALASRIWPDGKA